MGVCCLTNRTYTIFIDKTFRGGYLPTCLTMTKARPSAAFQRSCQSTHLFCNDTTMFDKLTNGNTWITSHFYFLTIILTIEHQTLLFFLRKVWLFQKFTENSNTIPKPNMDHFGRWHSRQESLRNHLNYWFSRNIYQIVNSRCSASLKWAPR